MTQNKLRIFEVYHFLSFVTYACTHTRVYTKIGNIFTAPKSFLVPFCIPSHPFLATTGVLYITVDWFAFSRLLHKLNHIIFIVFCLLFIILRFNYVVGSTVNYILLLNNVLLLCCIFKIHLLIAGHLCHFQFWSL